jgi:hypothetical protein
MPAHLPTADDVRAIVREELERALQRLGPGAPDVMDTVQAAAYARRSTKTIRKWARAGMPHKVEGRQIMVKRSDLDRWREGARDEERQALGEAVRRLTVAK